MTQAIGRRFRWLIEDTVRVGIDWDKVPTDAPIDLIATAERRVIGKWFTPWCIDKQGNACGYRSAGATPLTVSAAYRHRLDRHRKRQIAKTRRQVKRMAEPRDIIVCLYDLGYGRQLVLDGNHRLQAIWPLEGSFRVVGVSIAGPIDHAIVPDLRHWEAPSR